MFCKLLSYLIESTTVTNGSSPCIICGREMSLSEIRSVLLRRDIKTGYAHVGCATVEELKQCILEIAKRERQFYDDLMKIAPELNNSDIKNFELKYGTFEESLDYASTDSQLIISALLRELKERASRQDSVGPRQSP